MAIKSWHGNNLKMIHTQGEIVNADEIEETLRCLKKFLAMR